MKKIAMTGAGGKIGTLLRQYLLRQKYSLVSIDIKPLTSFSPEREEVHVINIEDKEALLSVLNGVDCIIHLAGIATEDAWPAILQNNINASYTLLEAAKELNIPRFIFASSNHVTGFYETTQIIDTQFPVRPDTLYGVSKVCGEALGRFFSDKYGLEVACVRIGAYEEKPFELSHLYMWISPADICHLIERCIIANYQFITLYGVSDNTRSFWHNDTAKEIGYFPKDNAEDYIKDITPTEIEKNVERVQKYQGGVFCCEDIKALMNRQ
jgi:uronate dehydrogenase